MAEYIDREALLLRIDCYGTNKFGMLDEDIRAFIKAQPTADVAPVRHGRWVEKEKYTFGIMYDCSLCENRILDTGHPWHYCPNCGAKMDEKEG